MKLNTKNTSIFAVALTAVALTGSFALADEFQGNEGPQHDGVGLQGHVVATVYDADGNIKQYMQSDNVIVNRGIDKLFVQTLSPSSPFTGGINTTSAAITHMQLGTGTSELGTGATALGGAVAGCIDTFTGVGAGGGAPLGLNATFDSTDGGGACIGPTLGEAGLFDSANGSGAGGAMFAQNAFSSTVILGASDSLDVDWTFTFTDT